MSKNFDLFKSTWLHTYGSRSQGSVDKMVKYHEDVMRRVAPSNDKYAEDKSLKI
jgi:hypothetical protein